MVYDIKKRKEVDMFGILMIIMIFLAIPGLLFLFYILIVGLFFPISHPWRIALKHLLKYHR